MFELVHVLSFTRVSCVLSISVYDGYFLYFTAIEIPMLHFIELTVKNDIHDIEIVWSDNSNNIYSDIEYVLSVSNSSSSTRKPVKFVTTVKYKRLILYAGIQYNISVTAQRCGGNLTSNSSTDLSLYFDGKVNMNN